MGHSLFKILTVLTFLVGNLFHANAQDTNVSLVVTKTNGQEQVFQLTETSQLYFENGERLVIGNGQSIAATFQLAEIQKLVCTEITGVNESSASEPLLIPNPTHDHFLINNLKNACEARIYSLDGRLMRLFTATEGLMVDISDLASGMYLLQIDGQTLKMMKL